MAYEDLKEGFYNLYSKREKKPVLVYLYYSRDACCRGMGFNTYDGGGFLPLSDLTDDTIITPVDIIERM